MTDYFETKIRCAHDVDAFETNFVGTFSGGCSDKIELADLVIAPVRLKNSTDSLSIAVISKAKQVEKTR